MTAPVPKVVEVDGIPMSALLLEVPRPRAVIVALHGGASKSVYWDCPNQPRLSLMRTGAALGFTVIALDRPGYGSSARHADDVAPAGRRVHLAYSAVDRLLSSRSRGAGLFLVGHSIGCELVLRMATAERGVDLLGVELSGTGRQQQPGARQMMDEWKQDASWPKRMTGLRDLLWQPNRLYPPEIVGGAAIASRTPDYEGAVVDTWASRDFPELAARVRVPVHFTLGEYERVWQSGPSALAEIAAMFTASPHVVVDEQADGGHNLSLCQTAMAYHLKILSFAEECAATRLLASAS